MTREPQRKFVRVYYVDLQRDYPAIFFDPTALSTWLRLLIVSDQTWPSQPVLPAAVRRADLDKLTKAGLVRVGDNRVYRLKGYDQERGDRQEKARRGARKRWENGEADGAAA